jgi:hypothetical protein
MLQAALAAVADTMAAKATAATLIENPHLLRIFFVSPFFCHYGRRDTILVYGRLGKTKSPNGSANFGGDSAVRYVA